MKQTDKLSSLEKTVLTIALIVSLVAGCWACREEAREDAAMYEYVNQ